MNGQNEPIQVGQNPFSPWWVSPPTNSRKPYYGNRRAIPQQMSPAGNAAHETNTPAVHPENSTAVVGVPPTNLRKPYRKITAPFPGRRFPEGGAAH
jgi:hypothetical protein